MAMVTHATLQDGAPVFLLSELSDHTQHLLAGSRGAFLVGQTAGLPNPQTGPRATLTGPLKRLEGAARDTARRRFLARHPGAELYAGFADFAFWGMTVERVHYVGGFARAVWIEDGLGLSADLCQALAECEESVLDHMNADHAAAVAAMAAVAATSGPPSVGVERDAGATEGWRLVAVDADGVDCQRDGDVRRLSFANPLAGVNELRPVLVDLARSARSETA